MAFGVNPSVLGNGSYLASGGVTPVSGPGSSTDNAIARWNGTGGDLLQNSVLIVADTTGALSGFATGAGITFHGGGTITGASGALTIAAGGTAQGIALTPSTTGTIDLDVADNAYVKVASRNFAYTDSTLSVLLSGSTALTIRSSNDTAELARITSNGAVFQGTAFTYGGNAAAASTTTRLIKAVTAIADGVATAVLTTTIPNAAHSGSLRVTLVGSLGAGGAIGANEATGTVSYDIGIARTAGVNAVVTASSAYGSGMANVAGAATITVTAAPSAIAGAVGDPNTFTVNVTITAGSGASTNHTCRVLAQIINANAAGITIS